MYVMYSGKLKQLGLILSVIIALLATPIVPCACDHNQSIAGTSAHCEPKSELSHQLELNESHHEETPSAHSHDKNASAHHHDRATSTDHEDAAKNISVESESPLFSLAENCDCSSCVAATPKVFAKSETVKVKKQTALTTEAQRVEITFTPSIITTRPIKFIRPFYLSDSFYNISPGRAPPIL